MLGVNTGNPEKYLSNMGSILGMALSARPRYDIQLGSLEICPHVELALQMDAGVSVVFKEQYGLILWEGGKYKQCEKLLEGVLEKQKQVLGDNHPHTLLTMGNLASTYSNLGEHKKGKELKATVLEKQKQVLAHTRTWESIKGPKNSTFTALEKHKHVLGDNHPQTLHTMGNLANTHSALGEHQKAKELKTTVLEKQKQVLALGEHQKAKELNTTVLEKQKQVLGNNHPDTLFTMGNLANTHLALGEHQKAKELNLTVLEKTETTYTQTWESIKGPKNSTLLCWRKQKQVLGDHHPHTLIIMGNLANTYSYLGEHQKAKELNATVLEKQKQVLGDNHPDTLHTMGNLANIYSALGQHQKAKELKATVLEKQSQFLLPTHSPSLHVSPPPPFPLQPSHAPSSLPPLSKLGRWLKKRKQTASAAAEPASAGEIKATRKHALQDNTRPH
ncbi:Tetratricopeptide repeat-domain-containing protein [Mycena olivaceomarginata]|nr:Tetratricopeptide repeat-domain-containing protein [Mycena olivaceomarginata]